MNYSNQEQLQPQKTSVKNGHSVVEKLLQTGERRNKYLFI